MTFGTIDRRTKAADVCVEVMAWLKSWNIRACLHFVGHAPPIELDALEYLATKCEVADDLMFHKHVDDQQYTDMLLAADVAIQLRTSSVLTLQRGTPRLHRLWRADYCDRKHGSGGCTPRFRFANSR